MPHRRTAMTRAAIAGLALATSVATGVGHAGPADARAVTMIWGAYLPGDTDYPETSLELPAGGTLTFVNLDYVIGSHSIVEYRAPGDPRPVTFESEVIDPGSATEVRGVAALAPGDYPFYCGNHGPTMRGVLRIR